MDRDNVAGAHMDPGRADCKGDARPEAFGSPQDGRKCGAGVGRLPAAFMAVDGVANTVTTPARGGAGSTRNTNFTVSSKSTYR